MKHTHTPGPWYWVKYPKTKTIRLMGERQLIVMDFVRWGMQSAQPRFIHITPSGLELMINADRVDIDTDPNARLIAAAPDLLTAVYALAACIDPNEGISSQEIAALDLAEAAIIKAVGDK